MYFCLYYTDSCRHSEFNSDFPQELSEIIHPVDFQQSIANINHARKKTLCEKILIFAIILCFVIAMIMAIAGIFLSSVEIMVAGIALLSVGSGMFVISIVISICVAKCIAWSIDTRMKEAIKRESMNHSAKLSIPITWRLHVTTQTIGSRRYPQIVVNHFVSVIQTHIFLNILIYLLKTNNRIY